MTKAVAGLFGAPWIDNQSSSKKQIQKPITSTLQSTRGAAPMQKLYFMLPSIDVDNLYMWRANGRHLGPGPLLALDRTAALVFQGLVLLASRGHGARRIPRRARAAGGTTPGGCAARRNTCLHPVPVSRNPNSVRAWSKIPFTTRHESAEPI